MNAIQNITRQFTGLIVHDQLIPVEHLLQISRQIVQTFREIALRRNDAGLIYIAIPLGFGQRPDKQAVGFEHQIHKSEVNPFEQFTIPRRIARSRRLFALTVHMRMDAVNVAGGQVVTA